MSTNVWNNCSFLLELCFRRYSGMERSHRFGCIQLTRTVMLAGRRDREPWLRYLFTIFLFDFAKLTVELQIPLQLNRVLLSAFQWTCVPERGIIYRLFNSYSIGLYVGNNKYRFIFHRKVPVRLMILVWNCTNDTATCCRPPVHTQAMSCTWRAVPLRDV